MPTQICHEHCPGGGGGGIILLAVLAAAVVTIVSALAAIIDDILAAIAIAGFAAVAIGAAVAIRLLMRDGLAVRRDYIPDALPVAVPSVVTVTRPRPRVRALPDPVPAIAPRVVLEGTVLDAAAIRQARP
jgi:hypothetical protein